MLPAGAKTPTPLERLTNDLAKPKKWLARVAREGEIRACYEASGARCVLHRALREWGHVCDVIGVAHSACVDGATDRRSGAAFVS